jgi:cysteine sulfinate desulfinase/cysteine desulfurase-like protein
LCPACQPNGKAAELARKKLPAYDRKVRPLRAALEEGILRSIPNTELNGHKVDVLFMNPKELERRGLG